MHKITNYLFNNMHKIILKIINGLQKEAITNWLQVI